MAPTLSLQDKIELVLICGDHYRSTREAAEIFNGRHPGRNVCFTAVAKVLKKFKNTGSVENRYIKTPHTRPVTSKEENVYNVVLNVTETPRVSTRVISDNTEVTKTSVRRILKKNNFRPYKPKFVQVLRDRDYDARFDFCAWYQGMLEENRNFSRNVLFSDEATFSSNGVVSSQNCRWWADHNPNFIIEAKDQYSFKVNVWCGILNDRLVGPFFFRQNLNSERYLTFLKTEISSFVDNLPLRQSISLFFQQDGASIHSTRAVQRWLNNEFDGQWIGRYSNNPWPARSPDLTPCDFFLWGYLKNNVFKQRPFRNVEHLEMCIRNCAAQVDGAMLRNVRKEMFSRTVKCMEREGGHVEY